MKKSIFFFLFLSACHTPIQENSKLDAFRSCRSTYGLGTREFDNCMKKHELREKQCDLQENKESMRLQGGRDVVRDKETETEPKKAPWKHSLMIPTGVK